MNHPELFLPSIQAHVAPVSGVRADCWVHCSPGSQRDFAESEREARAVLGSGERGATPATELDRPTRRASNPQQEVEVSRGVHGVEDVSVVWNHQFSFLRDDLHQLVAFLWLYFQVMLRHGSGNYSRSLVLIGQQYALVQIPVALLQADSYDAGVLGLHVIRRGLTGRAGRQRGEGGGASVGAERSGEGG